MESFGGTKPYLSDFEIADEPIKTMRHAGRESLRAENLKQRKRGRKQPIPQESEDAEPLGD